MSNKSFHKSMGDYLDVKRNGTKRAKRKARPLREPIHRQVGAALRQVRRKFRIFWKRLKAFFGGDHELDLNSLHQDVFVIERDEKRSSVFWRQFKLLFVSKEKKKKSTGIRIPTVMQSHIFDKKERLKKQSVKSSEQPEDIDMDKINETIKNNSV